MFNLQYSILNRLFRYNSLRCNLFAGSFLQIEP